MRDVERKRYELHARTAEFAARVKSAETILANGLAVMKRPYISLSFGKDSMVMAHFILSRQPDIPVVYVNCGEWDEWPDTPRVKQAFLQRFPSCHFIELHGPSIMEAFMRAGWYVQDEEDNATARKAQHDYGKSLGDVLNAEAKRRGYDGAFIGIRKEESRNRLRLFRMRGSLYFAEMRGMWACHPLMHWTGCDVWAYICSHNLPYNELYDLDPRGREMARNGAMFGSRSARYGRLVFLQKMYPDWFNRFVSRFPEVRRFL